MQSSSTNTNNSHERTDHASTNPGSNERTGEEQHENEQQGTDHDEQNRNITMENGSKSGMKRTMVFAA